MRFIALLIAFVLLNGFINLACAEDVWHSRDGELWHDRNEEVTTSAKILHVSLDKSTTKTVEVVVPDFVKLMRKSWNEVPIANREILNSLYKFPTDGTHTYFWPRKGESAYDGVTTDVVVNGVTVLRGEEKARAFCCGLTLQVAYDVLREEFHSGFDHDQFRKLWYCEDLFSPGPTDALLSANLGQKIDANDAIMGDFLQLWRHNKSGHSVIFMGWAVDTEGKLAGIHYWSTQISTDGIGFNTELLGPSGKAVDLSRSGFSRLIRRNEF